MNVSVRDKIILITGANSGIGKSAALSLAKKGATIVMVCRNKEKAELAQYEIIHLSKNENIHLLTADVSLQSEVLRLAETAKNIFPRIDVLINNAGILGPVRRTETREGNELTIATNFFSQVWMSLYFIDWLEKSEAPKIINITSYTHRLVALDWKDLMLNYSYRPFVAYGKSKLMAAMFAVELAEKLKERGVLVNSVDPGTVYTNISHSYPKLFRILYQLGEPFMNTPEKGADTIVKLCVDDKWNSTTGQVLKENKVTRLAKWCRNQEWRKKLWKETFSLLSINKKDFPILGS